VSTTEVGAQIRRLREARGLSQVALARKARIGRITLVRLEAGQQAPTPKTLERLARALGVTVQVSVRFGARKEGAR
jgi:transcriptional regulator with XRE-family HTH domain